MQSENPNGVQMTLYATKEEKQALMLIDLFCRLMRIICHMEDKMCWNLEPGCLHDHLPHFFEKMRVTPYNPNNGFYTRGSDGRCPAVSFFKAVTCPPRARINSWSFNIYGFTIEELKEAVQQPVQGLELPPGTRSMSHMLKVTRKTLVLMGVLEEAEEEVTAGA